jgi:hypothetical protein
MAVISSPAACNERTAASRPTPGPFTQTSTLRNPRFIASFAEASAAFCAANGVLFLDPLNPCPPAVAHEITFPSRSVKLIMVLLNVALM